MADSTNRAVGKAVYVAVSVAVCAGVNGSVNDDVRWVVAEVVWAATRIVRWVVVDVAPRANHPALQDFLKGVELQ